MVILQGVDSKIILKLDDIRGVEEKFFEPCSNTAKTIFPKTTKKIANFKILNYIILTSMDTPEGKLRFVRASIIFADGFKISINLR